MGFLERILLQDFVGYAWETHWKIPAKAEKAVFVNAQYYSNWNYTTCKCLLDLQTQINQIFDDEIDYKCFVENYLRFRNSTITRGGIEKRLNYLQVILLFGLLKIQMILMIKRNKTTLEKTKKMRCNNRDNLLQLSFTLKISIFSEAYI